MAVLARSRFHRATHVAGCERRLKHETVPLSFKPTITWVDGAVYNNLDAGGRAFCARLADRPKASRSHDTIAPVRAQASRHGRYCPSRYLFKHWQAFITPQFAVL
jgi:hypothetical protein